MGRRPTAGPVNISPFPGRVPFGPGHPLFDPPRDDRVPPPQQPISPPRQPMMPLGPSDKPTLFNPPSDTSSGVFNKISRTPIKEDVGIPPWFQPSPNMGLVPGAPASNRLASIYNRSPGLASLINPPRTDPGGEEDRQKMMDMQREMYRRFLAPPPGETPPVIPPVTPPVTPPVIPPGYPGPDFPGPEIPWTPPDDMFGGIGGLEDKYGISPEDLMQNGEPTFDPSNIDFSGYGNVLPDGFDPNLGQPPPEIPSMPAISDRLMEDKYGISPETLGFDPVELQERLGQLETRDIPQFDPTALQERLATLEGRGQDRPQFDPTDIPQFDPTALQERLGQLETRDIPQFDPTALQGRLSE